MIRKRWTPPRIPLVKLLLGLSFAMVLGLAWISRSLLLATTTTSIGSHPIALPPAPPRENVTIAYAISWIKCGDHQSNAEGMRDAIAVLRHSIDKAHRQSPYNYKFYAIVHRQAEVCSRDLLEQLGKIEILIKDTPLHRKQIRNVPLRKRIPGEWCCGLDEFIKLYAYTLPEPIVVHLDVDFLVTKPLDPLFDAILYRTSLEHIHKERPSEAWPAIIDTFGTRDWPQVIPGRKPGYQAGFLVTRTDPSVLHECLEIVKEGNFVAGFSRDNGWGGLGYGGFVGAMAMQGLMAYYYDVVRPHHWVELNQCRYNHMGMDPKYRHRPNMIAFHPKKGRCRNDLDDCEDCMVTPMDQIHSIHYTSCRKPWNCIGEVWRKVSDPAEEERLKINIDIKTVDAGHCLELQREWHKMRVDLETQLLQLTGDETIRAGQNGTYKTDVFQGHCNGNGGSFYLNMSGRNETLRRISELYEV